jgi:hypothetical protein
MSVVLNMTLRHPFLAEGPMRDHQRPPLVDQHDVPHDSVIARPGIPNGQGKCKGKGKGLQMHWEFVIPRGDLQI